MKDKAILLPSYAATEWLGSQESFKDYELLRARVNSGELKAGHWDEDEDETSLSHPLVNMQDQVGVITVSGGLVTGSAGWLMYYGYAVGYEDIRHAVLSAIAMGAKALVYDFKTNGGAVAGCGACGDFITEVGKRYTSVGYTETYCASAGIWLASATKDVRAHKYGKLGSIGTFMVLPDYTGMYSEQGIKHDVFRSSPLKGVGSGFEPLTPEAKASLQKGVDQAAKQFTDHVASSLSLDPSYVENTLATGEMWLADEAKKLGLVKKIQSLDQIVVELQKKTSNNASTSPGTYRNPMAASSLTGTTDMAAKKIKTIEEAEAEALAAAETSGTLAAGTETETEEEPETEVEKPVTETKASDGVSQLLAQAQASLMEYAGKTALLQAKLTELEAKVATFSATEAEVKPFLASYISGMTIKAGHAAPDVALLATQPLNALVTMAASAKAAFHSHFKSAANGRVSASNPEEETDPAVTKAVSGLDRIQLGLSTL